MAAPAIGLRVVDDAGPHRVQVNVADQLFQVAVPLHQDGSVASLEQMSRSPVLPIDEPGVAAGKDLHEDGEGLCAGLNRHVHVIGHPAIGVQAMLITGQAVSQESLPFAAVFIVEEDGLAAVAAQDNVIEPAGHVNSWLSRDLRGSLESFLLGKILGAAAAAGDFHIHGNRQVTELPPARTSLRTDFPGSNHAHYCGSPKI